MNLNTLGVEPDPFDWLPNAMTALSMYAPDGEFAGSKLPTDEAGRKAIWIFHHGEFMKIQLGGHPDQQAPDAAQPTN